MAWRGSTPKPSINRPPNKVNSGPEMSNIIKEPAGIVGPPAFGPSRNQDYVFKMREKMLQQLQFYPEIGDIVLFNDRYYEIDNVVQEQLLGGQPDKSHSIICNAHYTKYTSLNIMERND